MHLPKNLPHLLPLGVALAAALLATPALAQITFFQGEGFTGRAFTTDRQIARFSDDGMNDQASSVDVASQRWEVCDQPYFQGRCVVLRPGHYPTLAAMRMDNRISSVRQVRAEARVEDERYAPVPAERYAYGRRQGERLYEAQVLSVRAVMGPPERRCWVERQQVVEQQGRADPGASMLAGALIGGVLGHQLGGRGSRDLATAGGAVAGAAVGAEVARQSGGGEVVTNRDVQRCANTPDQGPPAYWDVTYTFQGLTHQLQLRTAPGSTITVNAQGEPRS